MQFSTEMLKTHPLGPSMHIDQIEACIRACFDCAQACTDCADACLSEADLDHLVRCIRLNLDCADICEATGRIVSRQTEPSADILALQLAACIGAARTCGAECQMHSSMQHCRICAEACNQCETACQSLLEIIHQKPAGASPYLSTC